MRSTSAIMLLTTLLAPFVAAELHNSAICVDYKGEVAVYNEAATKAACGNYRVRNTGDNKWDKCPDCEMKVIGNLNVCHSEDEHIGGDEINYYCEKINGAGGSWAN
ncbi:hypothetical protein E8E13_001457 [Curvularia kusanoi]|uniref:Uncharacterized protein n=1 Tax=Curvularia kusanoi TaxID=90978 RepID=A0A9P4T6E6_CURKU|nr:hypothetical protein E8E13_001457 [Curvularia kusanoi]